MQERLRESIFGLLSPFPGLLRGLAHVRDPRDTGLPGGQDGGKVLEDEGNDGRHKFISEEGLAVAAVQ